MARDKKLNMKMDKARMVLDEFRSRIQTTDLKTSFIVGSIILVSIIGLYALFSPVVLTSGAANPACGRIVVAASGPSLRAGVSPTLVGADYFLVVDPLERKLLEVAKNPYAGMWTGGADDIAYFVAGKGEEAVIAGSVNPRAYSILRQFGVRVFGGYNGRVADAVALYRQARIAQGPGQVNVGMAGAGVMPVANQPLQGWGTAANRVWDPGPFGWGTVANQPLQGWGTAANRVWDPGPFGWGTVANQPLQGWGTVANQPLQGWGTVANQPLQGWGTAANQPLQNWGTAAWGAPNAAPAPPPITPAATMPHGYRGVCSNCHKIFGGGGVAAAAPGSGATPAAFGLGGRCILR